MQTLNQCIIAARPSFRDYAFPWRARHSRRVLRRDRINVRPSAKHKMIPMRGLGPRRIDRWPNSDLHGRLVTWIRVRKPVKLRQVLRLFELIMSVEHAERQRVEKAERVAVSRQMVTPVERPRLNFEPIQSQRTGIGI